MFGEYKKVQYQGHTLDQLTRAALLTAQEKFGEDVPATMSQGSYNSSVPQSGGTHDGGGAFDLSPFNADRRVHALRSVGFAAWHRFPSEGDWPEHIHCELIGNKKASPGAKAQWASYEAGRNGLVSNLEDPVKYHPDDRFGTAKYRAFQRAEREAAAREERRKSSLGAAQKALETARENTDGADGKARVQAVIADVRKL